MSNDNIYKLIFNLQEKINIIEQKVNTLEYENKSLKEKISNINNCSVNIINKQISNIRDFNLIKINCSDDILKRYLNNCNVKSDINLCKFIYFKDINKENYCIKYERYFEYYTSNEWIKDMNGKYIIEKILKLIKQKYLSINNFDNYRTNMEKMIENQNHINKMSEKKYLNEFTNKLKNILL